MLKFKSKNTKLDNLGTEGETQPADAKILKHKTLSKPKKALRVIRNIIISIVILLALIAATAALYIWYSGLKPPQNTATATQTKSNKIIAPKHVQPAKNNPIGVAEESLISPVKPGSNSTIMIRTSPNAKCTIKVEYNKVASKDSGLIPKTADSEFGMVDWTWTVSPATPIGKWPVTVSCTANKKSALLVSNLVVSNKAPAQN